MSSWSWKGECLSIPAVFKATWSDILLILVIFPILLKTGNLTKFDVKIGSSLLSSVLPFADIDSAPFITVTVSRTDLCGIWCWFSHPVTFLAFEVFAETIKNETDACWFLVDRSGRVLAFSFAWIRTISFFSCSGHPVQLCNKCLIS